MTNLIIVIVLALMLGSFLNVVIYRLPRQESLLWPGSHCPRCGHPLRGWDLIPVLSYLLRGGRCRYCQASIKRRYPLVELVTALVFGLVYYRWGFSIETAVGWIFSVILLICTGTDAEVGMIPNLVTYPGMLIGLGFSFSTIGSKSALLGMISFAGILLGTALLSHGGMGGGDIKLAGVIGAFVGWPNAVLALLISSLTGGIWAVCLLSTGRADRKTAVRFGPFLALAAWIVWLWGTEIIAFYLDRFI